MWGRGPRVLLRRAQRVDVNDHDRFTNGVLTCTEPE